MKKNTIYLTILLLVVVTDITLAHNEKNWDLRQLNDNTSKVYPKGRISLSDGTIIQGKKMIMTNESIVMLVNGEETEFALIQINKVEGKGLKAKRWATGCGLGCMSLVLVTLAASGGETTDPNTGETSSFDSGQVLAGGILWSALFAGGGALIGSILDEWEVLYQA